MHNRVGTVENFIKIKGTQVTQVMTGQALGLSSDPIDTDDG